MTVLDWPLDSDPAIRWQVLRDLADVNAALYLAGRLGDLELAACQRHADIKALLGQHVSDALTPTLANQGASTCKRYRAGF
jgi:hypothetical protein